MSVIEFPGGPGSSEEQSRDEMHAEAFRDLEGHLSDCVTMSQLAAEQMENAKWRDERLPFAVYHLHEMLLNLQKHYKAAYNGEDALTKRLIRHPARSSGEIREAVAVELAQKCQSLPPEMQDIIEATVDHLLERQP